MTNGSGRKSPKDWSPAEKIRLVAEADGLSDEELGAFLRKKGVHEEQLLEWRKLVTEALGEARPRRSKPSPESKRIKKLEAELRRKEKALAETAALLVLKKKAQAIWGDEDDSTNGRNEN